MAKQKTPMTRQVKALSLSRTPLLPRKNADTMTQREVRKTSFY
ncbi:hypothetical protein NB574_12120 [Vibrio vulnificus]|nr:MULTISPECIES: hypothetical protein [Vibrio]MCR9703534.1 hypothetical protein [Vibrio vulnificus]MCR9809113.1 hypothetical protein [Vibrio parahaemolyticus]MCR9928695.1 hypothetical protein [Vibrio parahaemolyticus]MCR9955286.1 hypothetical protein [Vibrio parahaemolyticus]MDF5330810.1 hypothetical protein [Vibrio parahaemolyticus]